MKHYECNACSTPDADPCILSYHDDVIDVPCCCPYGSGSSEPNWKLIDPDGDRDWRINFTQDGHGGTMLVVDVCTNEPITWVAGIDLEKGVLLVNPDLQSNLEDEGYTTRRLKFTDGLLEITTPQGDKP